MVHTLFPINILYHDTNLIIVPDWALFSKYISIFAAMIASACDSTKNAAEFVIIVVLQSKQKCHQNDKWWT